MAQRVRKITPEILKSIIVQEARKLYAEAAQEKAQHPDDVDADETDASEYADTLAKKVDYLKVLNIHEKRLRLKLAKISEAKKKLARKV